MPSPMDRMRSFNVSGSSRDRTLRRSMFSRQGWGSLIGERRVPPKMLVVKAANWNSAASTGPPHVMEDPASTGSVTGSDGSLYQRWGRSRDGVGTESTPSPIGGRKQFWQKGARTEKLRLSGRAAPFFWDHFRLPPSHAESPRLHPPLRLVRERRTSAVARVGPGRLRHHVEPLPAR